jgi:hypothetical protein
MESFEFLHGYICSICVPILFAEGLCGWPTVMVQLFDVAPTVMELIKNNNLLEKFTSVFHRVLKMSLNQRGIVSVEHEAIRHKVYLRPQRDLNLIVSHSPVAVNVLNERLDVFEDILKVVTYLQWMNPYTQNRSLDFEDNAWTLAMQLEACSLYS